MPTACIRPLQASSPQPGFPADWLGPVDKIARRLDHILAVDPTPTGVLRGLSEAAGGISKRGLGNNALSEAVA